MRMTPADLLKELYSLGSRIWIFFYTLGIIQYKYRCLISQFNRDLININYTKAIRAMNKHCQLDSFYDIFNINHKKYLESQGAFLPDNKSMVNLIFPVLSNNIDELCEICEIINKHKDYSEKDIRIKEINYLVSEGLRTGTIERM